MTTKADRAARKERRAEALFALLALLPIALAWKAVSLAEDWPGWSLALAVTLLTHGALLKLLTQRPDPIGRTGQPATRQSTGAEAAAAGSDTDRPDPAPAPMPAERFDSATARGATGSRDAGEPTTLQPDPVSQARSEFLTQMSHELRTPINGIIGMSELMAQRDLGADERESVEIVRASADRLLEVVEDILDFSSIEAGKTTIETLDFRLRDTLDLVIDQLSPRAAAKDLELRLDVDVSIPEWLRGDALRLEQILLNLVGNAIKFTPQGHVIVAAALEPESPEVTVAFIVQDTGIGIPPDLRPYLFEPFTRADTAAAREHGGTGLGLAISRRLVDLMGGRIEIDSTPQAGSTFHVVLPFSPSARLADRPQPAVATAAAGPWPNRSRRVLVVEDEKVNRVVAIRLLEHLGYRAEAVDNGRMALAAVERGSFDLVLMDCQMPGLDGYTTTRLIRQREGGDRHTPIVAVTAHALQGDREKCLAAGMDDYLAKPFREAELDAVLGRWLAPRASGGRSRLGDPSQALDREMLETLRRLDGQAASGLLSRAIEDFLQQESPKLDAMRRALGSANHLDLVETAHSLCGSAGSLGALRLARLCGEIVDLAQYNTSSDCLNECQLRLRDVEMEFDRAVAELRQVLNEPPGPSPGASVMTH